MDRPTPRCARRVNDAVREYGYDRSSPIGTLARALDAAPIRGWTVVSMKNDWRQVFHVESK